LATSSSMLLLKMHGVCLHLTMCESRHVLRHQCHPLPIHLSMKGIFASPLNGYSLNRKESKDISPTEYFVETDFGDLLLAIEIQTHSCSARKNSKRQ
jgi:predicted urease superfamily metal-dependent hydrolase